MGGIGWGTGASTVGIVGFPHLQPNCLTQTSPTRSKPVRAGRCAHAPQCGEHHWHGFLRRPHRIGKSVAWRGSDFLSSRHCRQNSRHDATGAEASRKYSRWCCATDFVCGRLCSLGIAESMLPPQCPPDPLILVAAQQAWQSVVGLSNARPERVPAACSGSTGCRFAHGSFVEPKGRHKGAVAERDAQHTA